MVRESHPPHFLKSFHDLIEGRICFWELGQQAESGESYPMPTDEAKLSKPARARSKRRASGAVLPLFLD
jgi:hypothetical protein